MKLLKTTTSEGIPGGGTVTSFAFNNANGISGTVTNPTSTPELTLDLGAIDPTTVNGVAVHAGTGTPDLTVNGTAAVSGTNTGDQSFNLDDILDVSVTGATDDQVLAKSGSNWIAKTLTGSGTVTKVSVATANGFSGTVATDTTTPVITIIPQVPVTGTSTPTLSVTGTTVVSGTNTGDQTLSGLGGVAANGAITGATKTKITYDAKGLVTNGVDATTADIADLTNKRYVTDAQLTVIGNTSGTNSGDSAGHTGLVPYTGASGNVDLGSNNLTSGYVFTGNLKYYHGIIARPVGAGNPLPTFITTTTFTLGATANPIPYFYEGIYVNVNSNKTVTLGDGTAGKYHIYFNGSAGTLLASKTFPGISDTSNVYICTASWNGTDYGLINDERHGYKRSHVEHVWQHKYVGVRYGSGCALTVTGTGATATLSLTSGEIADEDIEFVVDAQTNCRLVWQTGATTYTFDKTLSTTPYKRGTGDRPVYIDSSSAYAVTTINSATNRYMVYFMYLTTDLSCPLYCVTHTSTSALVLNGYTTIALARAVPWPSITDGSISVELKPIYRVIVRADGAMQAIDPALDDYRGATSLPQAGGIASTTASTVTFIPSGTISNSNMQSVMEEFDTETQASLATKFTNGLNAFGADSNLGNSDNYGLNIKTNNTTRIGITNAGQIQFNGYFNFPTSTGTGYLKSDGTWSTPAGGSTPAFNYETVNIGKYEGSALTLTVGTPIYTLIPLNDTRVITGYIVQFYVASGANATIELAIMKRNGSGFDRVANTSITGTVNSNFQRKVFALAAAQTISATASEEYFVGILNRSASATVQVLHGFTWNMGQDGYICFTGATSAASIPATETTKPEFSDPPAIQIY